MGLETLRENYCPSLGDGERDRDLTVAARRPA